MLITEELIQQAGTYSRAILWLKEKPRTFDELVAHNPTWAAWLYTQNLIPANIAERYRDANGNLFCVNCTDCYNCYNCVNCSNCIGCASCTDCADCVNCRKCSNCSDCFNCHSCINCTDCVNVTEGKD